MNKLLSLILLLSLSFGAYAQDAVDALRYSQNSFGGTARGMGIAGAFGALGADFTSFSVNPAGIGFYRGSELVLTPSLSFSNNETDFLGNISSDSKSNFQFHNVGLTMTNMKRNRSKSEDNDRWVSVAYGFGMNRLNSFHNRTYFRGFNSNNSIADNLVAVAGNYSPEELLSGNDGLYSSLAYRAYMINDEADGTYSSPAEGGNVTQEQLHLTEGATNEYLFTMGANYANRLYMGLSVGIPHVRYESSRYYEETDDRDSLTYFNHFEHQDILKAEGLGANLKLGLIYRVNDFVRLGGSLHTPSSIAISEEFTSRMFADVAEPGSSTITSHQEDASGNFDYTLKTPWKFVGSAAFIIKKKGFVSLDYEFIDYSAAEYSFEQIDLANAQNQRNQEIARRYKGTSNLRLGAEYAIDKFRVRGGYALYGSPFAEDQDSERQSLTAGVGFRDKKVFADLAFVHNRSNDYFQPYTLSNDVAPASTTNTVQNNIVFTMGFRF